MLDALNTPKEPSPGARKATSRATGGAVWHAAVRELRRSSVGLVAGLLGSLAAVVVMVALRLTWGTPTPPELVGERILPQLTAGQFVMLLIQFEPHPKTGPLFLALLGQVAVGILLAPLYERIAHVPAVPAGRWPSRRAWLIAGGFAVAMEAVATVLFWPVLSEGLFGDPVDKARLLTILSLLLTFATYAATVALASHWLRRAWGAWAAEGPARSLRAGAPNGDPLAGTVLAIRSGVSPADAYVAPVSRRAALQAAGATVLVVAAGVYAIDRLLGGYLASSNLAYEGNPTPARITSALTPNGYFYVVSKNAVDPVVNAGQWQLEVTGLVRQPKRWSYSQVRSLESETRAVTMECISNGVGGHLMSTAAWQGVTLKTLLDAADGALPAASHVLFTSVDGYNSCLPLADLLQARTLLAYDMNGVALPHRHGFPLRAVVPGRYGEQSAKWVTRIELLDYNFQGFYQSQGWSAAQLETTSRIDTPRRSAPLGPVTVGGIAFAGIRGVAKVEVSADGGVSWNVATLTPPLSDQSWVFWRWLWRPAGAGVYTLVVRATDGTGATQTATDRGTVPDGATGWQRVQVTVA